MTGLVIKKQAKENKYGKKTKQNKTTTTKKTQ